MFILGFFLTHTENDGGRGGVDVTVLAVRLQHRLVAAVERPHTQLDLREIKRQDKLPLRCLDEASDTDGIVRLARHILCIGLSAVHPSGIRRERKYLRMDTPRNGVDIFHIPVNVGGLDLAPLAVILYQKEQMRHLRTMLVAPFLEKGHGHVVRRLTIGFRGL